jgi:hypothetical protein
MGNGSFCCNSKQLQNESEMNTGHYHEGDGNEFMKFSDIVFNAIEDCSMPYSTILEDDYFVY